MKSVTKKTVAVLSLLALVGASAPAVAYADSTTTTTTPSASFVAAQQKLEAQLASRAARLQHISADVTGATTLSQSTSTILQARLATETSSIQSLAAKVPTDTTQAELNADRAAMLKDNRVYAVMSPQVFESIEASVVANQVASLQGNQSTLASEVASLAGLPGYQNALNHYNNYVTRIANWSTKIAVVEETVLDQTPQGFPGNAKTFARENRQILAANVALAYADYDVSIIGLASGGYTGS